MATLEPTSTNWALNSSGFSHHRPNSGRSRSTLGSGLMFARPTSAKLVPESTDLRPRLTRFRPASAYFEPSSTRPELDPRPIAGPCVDESFELASGSLPHISAAGGSEARPQYRSTSTCLADSRRTWPKAGRSRPGYFGPTQSQVGQLRPTPVEIGSKVVEVGRNPVKLGRKSVDSRTLLAKIRCRSCQCISGES